MRILIFIGKIYFLETIPHPPKIKKTTNKHKKQQQKKKNKTKSHAWQHYGKSANCAHPCLCFCLFHSTNIIVLEVLSLLLSESDLCGTLMIQKQ